MYAEQNFCRCHAAVAGEKQLTTYFISGNIEFARELSFEKAERRGDTPRPYLIWIMPT